MSSEQGKHATNPWVVLVLICIAQFMVVLDATVTNVALPSIQKDLGLTEANLQWIINAYTLVFGGFLLLGGRLGDLLGRKRLFLVGLVIFTFASLMNGLLDSEGMLIGFRALQGLGAALISPAALSIISTTFEEGRRARQGARGLGRDRDRRRGLRADSRRRARRVVLVAVDLLHQRADRDRRLRALASPRPRVARRAGACELRHRRRGHGDRRADVARLRDREGRDGRLDVVDHDRLLRPVGAAARELRRDRVAVEGTARAALDLPDPLAHDGQHHDVPRDVGDVRDVLLQHALHPARARLLAARRPGSRSCRSPRGSWSRPGSPRASRRRSASGPSRRSG